MPNVFPVAEIARPAYYDRQPVTYSPLYSGLVGPHALTVRFTYTPPFYYAAFVETATSVIQRYTAAGTPGAVAAQLRFTPYFGGATANFSLLYQMSNVPTNVVNANVTGLGYVAYGDVIDFATQDLSVGGTCVFYGSIKFTEFVY